MYASQQEKNIFIQYFSWTAERKSKVGKSLSRRLDDLKRIKMSRHISKY